MSDQLKLTSEVIETSTVHFRIQPEWLVERVRELWMEERYTNAIKILDAGFPQMSIEDKIYILTGKKKLVYAGDPDAEEKSIYNLVGDDWVPSGNYKGMKVASWLEVLDQAQLFRTQKEKMELVREISTLAWSAHGIPCTKGPWKGRITKGSPRGWIRAEYVIELLCRVFPVPDQEQWNRFFDKYSEDLDDIIPPVTKEEKLVDKILQENPNRSAFVETVLLKSVDAEDEELAKQWCAQNANNIDIYMAHDRVLMKKKCPPPSSTLEEGDGWLLPDGKFYPCEYMEHIWLAEKLGMDEERKAENIGWIKIHHSITGALYLTKGGKNPTQKQINTLFDWCEKHKEKFPDWAKE